MVLEKKKKTNNAQGKGVVKKKNIWSRDTADERGEQFKQGRRDRKEQCSSSVPLATSSEVSRPSFGKAFVTSLLFHLLSDFSMVLPESLTCALLAQLGWDKCATASKVET